MTKRLRFLSLPVLLVLAGACGKPADAPPPPPPPPPPINTVLPNIPIPPQGIALSQESGAEATQITFTTPLKPDSILKHYRRVLGGLDGSGFRLVSEVQQQGMTIFMAEQDGPMVWVTVKSNGDGGTAVTIAGGATIQKPDTSKKIGAKKPGE